ncbi:MAG: alpha/beta family hydrolase [Actinomycetota bacterium]
MVRGIVLFPGAGSGADHPSLVALEQALHPLPVARVDFAYRLAGRHAPDRAPVLVRSVRDAVAAACERWSCTADEVVIGGRSMGGRMCSLAVAGFDGNDRGAQPAVAPLAVAGLVCIAYPLHPPAQPEKLRVAHLPHVVAPALFVSGTRDEFASPDELTSNLTVMQRAPDVHFVDGARHDLRGRDAIVASLVATWVRGLRA